MINTWSSHVLLQLGSSEGQGFTIALLQDYSGLPPHSLIPKGVQFTSPDDLAIENWLTQAPRKIQTNTLKKYILRQPINKNEATEILKDACRFLYG